MRIALIDYGIGNVRSIRNAVDHLDESIFLSSSRDQIMASDGVILPGVGAFRKGMQHLLQRGIPEILHDFCATKKPLLGICLGMQLLFEESDEFGLSEGLGLIPGKVSILRRQKDSNEKLPHIGWSKLKKKNLQWKNTILQNIGESDSLYFIHSFACEPRDSENILSLTPFDEGLFCSSVKRGNIYGYQFHPEKSGTVGLKILKNFLEIVGQD